MAEKPPGDVDPFALAPRVTEFWSFVDRSEGPDACHPWTGYANEDGYGEFFLDGRMYGAHELAITLTTGERRAPGLDTCHSRGCTTRLCCNRRHLRFDTRQANVNDAVHLGRNHVPAARVSDEDVRVLRVRRQAGAPIDVLAERYGISESLVSMIATGRRRANAPGPITPPHTHARRAG